MNFSIPQIMSRLCAPQHRVSCSWALWRRLLRALRVRGKDATRESGAFLLGERLDGRARISDFALYDDLDPHSLDTGIVRFDGCYYDDLWRLCRDRGMSVVADVHVHPAGSYQSGSDRENPMISRAGHVALIIPDFAASPVRRSRVGIYEYQGGKVWRAIPHGKRAAFFHIGL
jgi:proteasome lid subunit RPN8/RPN11